MRDEFADIRLPPGVVEVTADDLSGIDLDADPTADDPHAIVVDGVRLSSRRNKQFELDLLARVVMALDADERRRIGSIWVDSPACAFYTIWFRPEDRAVADPLAKAVADKLIALSGGYNGVIWQCGRDELGWLDPHWQGDGEVWAYDDMPSTGQGFGFARYLTPK
jgi:hypothetical protein